jgi:hypothetical protein
MSLGMHSMHELEVHAVVYTNSFVIRESCHVTVVPITHDAAYVLFKHDMYT